MVVEGMLAMVRLLVVGLFVSLEEEEGRLHPRSRRRSGSSAMAVAPRVAASLG